MSKYSVAVIVGSLRKESVNLKLAKAIAKLGEDKFNVNYIHIADLPLFNQDLESDVPQEVTRIKREIESADAVLFVTPEYNRSYPGVLKNAIDWASRPYGKNSFAGKPAALCGASVGSIGTACSQHSLRPTLVYLDLMLMGQPEVYFHFKDQVIDLDGNIKNDETKHFLQAFTNHFVAWIKKHA